MGYNTPLNNLDCIALPHRFVSTNNMSAIEVNVRDQTFRIIRNSADSFTFSVFNYATCHIITKNDFGIWKRVQHLFGTEIIPIDEIGDIIDNQLTPWPHDEAETVGRGRNAGRRY